MSQHASISTLASLLRRESPGRAHVEGVRPETLHFFLAALGERTGRRFAVVVRDDHRGEAVAAELLRLLGEGGRGEGTGQTSPVLLLPTPSVSPYVEVSADTRRMLRLLGGLGRLACMAPPRFLVLPVPVALFLLPSPETLRQLTNVIRPGMEFDREALLDSLVNAGYVRTTSVFEPGTFATRGSLLDVFSPAESRPARADFFGDRLDALSWFDPGTQLTVGEAEAAFLAPATEVLDKKDLAGRARRNLLALADELDHPSQRLFELMEQLRAGELPAGVSALRPLLCDASASIADYLAPAEWTVLYDDRAGLKAAAEALLKNERARYESYVGLGRLAPPPERLYLSDFGTFDGSFHGVNVAPLDPEAEVHVRADLERPVGRNPAATSKLAEFEEKAAQRLATGFRVVAAAAEASETKKLAHLLSGRNTACRLEPGPLTFEAISQGSRFPGILLFTSPLEQGVDSPELRLYLATARELFDKKGRTSREQEESSASRQEKLHELQEGDFVVHRDYGIGRFSGVVRKAVGAGEYACLQIEYADSDTLFVPVHNAAVVQKYVGSGKAAPKVDRLGSGSWQVRVSKARTAAKKLAFSLLDLYAKRGAVPGHAFSPGDEYFEEFEASFPYDETPDQAAAVADTLADMERPHPMDRLICGDVGFGKTEVAVRAAFKAVLDGRQVAVLVPTTILAEQHRITFQERMRSYPVMVESFSRFKSDREQREILKRLAQGGLDIVIGTHRLLGKDVCFKELGLLVIDEEHRFGVGHKEKLKALRTSVDVLSLTATPIPRTLHMALTGIRDFSVIRTAPEGRQDIRTTLVRYDPDVIADALRFELARGGQVFFLHNRVEDLDTLGGQLQELVPGMKIAVAHGQMSGDRLERTMIRFLNREADLLLCTTIIESGLDIPSVNTLIVNNAHMFGLAQLYQIRGRIGRSTTQAYAYFIVPPVETMNSEARSRLAALARFSAVGAGFQIASMDMELRGAGDLLGPEQSGHLASVGFDLFVHLLHESVEQLKEQTPLPTAVHCEVDIPGQAYLPEESFPDRHQRLVFYRMIASCESTGSLDKLRSEMQDRFGLLPEPALRLLAAAEIRLRGRDLGLERLQAGGEVVKASIGRCPDAVLDALLRLVKEQPMPIRISPDRFLTAHFPKESRADLFARARQLLSMIESRVEKG
jgi:transcription-repair coupling factor (superfamily II helicase)